MALNKSIILVGIKHSGKTTQGRALAAKYNCEFYDTDDVIQELMGKSPREIYNTEGKDSFLGAEKLACQHLKSILESKPVIVATGGGICENEEAVRHLATNSIFVYLNVDEKTAADRIVREAKTDGDNNITDQSSLPSYIAKKNPATIDDVRAYLHNFYEERTKKYSMLADITINPGSLGPAKVTAEIVNKVHK